METGANGDRLEPVGARVPDSASVLYLDDEEELESSQGRDINPSAQQTDVRRHPGEISGYQSAKTQPSRPASSPCLPIETMPIIEDDSDDSDRGLEESSRLQPASGFLSRASASDAINPSSWQKRFSSLPKATEKESGGLDLPSSLLGFSRPDTVSASTSVDTGFGGFSRSMSTREFTEDIPGRYWRRASTEEIRATLSDPAAVVTTESLVSRCHSEVTRGGGAEKGGGGGGSSQDDGSVSPHRHSHKRILAEVMFGSEPTRSVDEDTEAAATPSMRSVLPLQGGSQAVGSISLSSFGLGLGIGKLERSRSNLSSLGTPVVSSDIDALQPKASFVDHSLGFQADFPERPTMTVEKADLLDDEKEELLSLDRQRRSSLGIQQRALSKANDTQVAQRYAMMSDMVNLVGSQLDPSKEIGTGGMIELMTSLRVYAKEMISCDRCSLFVRVKKAGVWTLWTMLETGQEISIPMYSGLAGAAAASRAAIRVADAQQDSRWNSEVDKFTGYNTVSVLAVPVLAGGPAAQSSQEQADPANEDLLGVLQVVNKIRKRPSGVDEASQAEAYLPFDKEDENVLQSLATMSAITLQVWRALESERRAKERFATLGSLARLLLRHSTQGIRSLYQHIQSEAARLCSCEVALIYMLDETKDRLVVDPPSGGSQVLRLPPSWASSGKGSLGHNFIAGHAVRTGKVVMVVDVENDTHWCKCVEQRRLGLGALHSVIAIPIIKDGPEGKLEVIGVLEALNKTDSKGRCVEFEVDDLEFLEGFCGYIASAVGTSQAFSATAAAYKNMDANMVPQETTTPSRPRMSSSRSLCPRQQDDRFCLSEIDIDVETLHRTRLLDWNFDPIAKADQELSRLIHPVFAAFGLQRDFRIGDATLENFVREVANGYQQNSFHNYQHAWSVLQCCVHMLHTMGDMAEKLLCKVDILALFVAAICHDVGHTGTNNMFHQRTCSELALLYNDVSILENHHSATCFKIMSESSKSNVLSGLSKKEFQVARRFICHAILCTDMSRHDRELALLRSHSSTPFQKENEDDRQLLVSSWLHAADLSNPARSASLAERWARLLAEEMLSQTSKEAEAGLEVSAFMLGGYKHTNEIFFAKTFVLPQWEVLGLIMPPMNFYVEQVQAQLGRLQRRIESEEANRSDEQMMENRNTFHSGDFRSNEPSLGKIKTEVANECRKGGGLRMFRSSFQGPLASTSSSPMCGEDSDESLGLSCNGIDEEDEIESQASSRCV